MPKDLFYALLVVLLCVVSAEAADLFSPEKPITIVGEDRVPPSWKSNWDEARTLVQQQELEAAVQRYLSVLEEKPHIEEVKWELFKVLLSLKDYKRAAFHLERLLEINPSKEEYLLSAGQLALERKEYDEALNFFGQVLEQDPLDTHAEQALKGMVQAMLAEDKEMLAIPLMEQLYARGNPESDLLLELARACKAAGDTAKASYYYAELVKKFRVASPILKEAAQLFESIGSIEQAAKLWQALLESGEGDILLNQKLAEYYLQRQQETAALPHLLHLTDKGVDRQKHLLTIANIYLFHAQRPDKALLYYERYQNEFPGGEDVSTNIADIQLILANDFLTIVENDGADMLWQDLLTVTPDRIGLFKAMANLLEEMGKTSELIEVLQILNTHAPQDLEILRRLGNILVAAGQYEQCLAYLGSKSGAVPFDGSMYLLLAQCQEALGKDEDRLQSYLAFLKIEGANTEIQKKAIMLAGATGDIATVDLLLPEPALQECKDKDLLQIYFTALMKNALYETVQRRIESLLERFPVTSDAWASLMLIKAESYQAQGASFAAEQLLRQVLAEQPESIDALLQLTEYSLRKDDVSAAHIWLRTVNQLAQSNLEKSMTDKQRDEIFNRNVRLQWLSGNRKTAQEMSGKYLKQQFDIGRVTDQDMQTIMFSVRYLDTTPESKEIWLRMLRAHQNTVAEQVQPAISSLLDQDLGSNRLSANNRISAGETSLTSLLDSAELLQRWGFVNNSIELLEKALSSAPDSLRALAMKANAEALDKNYEAAVSLYQNLSHLWPHEKFFQERYDHFRVLAGTPAELESDVAAVPAMHLSPEKVLARARDLWNADQWDEALQLYDSLQGELSHTITEGFQLISATQTFRRLFAQDKSHAIFISTNEEELLDRVMSPSFFVTHRAEEISRLSSNYFKTYRWWKIVHKEYEAKLALNQRQFFQAERSYHELYDIDSEAAEYSYSDLATIYGRIGKRQKEAEVYEIIRDTKRDIPDLEEAEKRNTRQRQPHLLVDAWYREEQGRDDHIDITQSYAGANLQFTPALFQEASAWFGRNEYGNSESSVLAKSVYVNGRYAIFFNDYLQGEVQLGFENFDTGGESYLLYDIAIRGKLEEKLNVFASINQQPVTDTIIALDRGIYKKQLQAGMSLEYVPGFLLGFDFSLHDYNDKNDGKTFNVFSSYRFFWEKSSFNVGYNYQKLENTLDQDSMPQEAENLPPFVPYWSPGKFWKHFVSGEYRIELWPTGKLQSGTSYVSALYGVGFEDGDRLVQQAAVHIFLEMTPVFLVKGTFSSDWSEDYERYSAFASLAYRW